MRRVHPFLSTFGLLATAGLLTVLAGMLWRTGGLAFSPGRLSAVSKPGITLKGFASHEAFEAECVLCHQPLKTQQATLCLDCHARVAAQIQSGEGSHSQITNVQQCYACHSDHRGRSFDPGRSAHAHFDHSTTHFSLLRHQVDYDATPMGCDDCHQDNLDFTESEPTCSQCHAKRDPAFMVTHAQDFGADCLDCHDGQDQMADFDHQKTDFPLVGKHMQVRCAGCHALQTLTVGINGGGPHMSLLAGAQPDCAGCHNKDDPHVGMTSSECDTCHTPDGWSPARWDGAPFEHTAQAGFSLASHQKDYDGSPLSCNDCHLGNAQGFDTGSCVGCHSQGEERAAFMLKHQEQYGADCTSCHDGVDRMSNFSHASVFPLEGRHAEIPCQDCHRERVFAGTSNVCVECHAEPAIHAGFFGLDCQYCHTTQAWNPALLRMHGFPLDHGGQGEIACGSCHASSYVEYTCYGCHEHEQGETAEKHQEESIQGDTLQDCAECHPTGKEEG
jgi:hypothetical protein